MLSSKALLRVAYSGLPACTALALVACSSGARYAPTPVVVGANSTERAASSVALSMAPDFSLSGEVLTASASSVTVNYLGVVGSGSETKFSARGKAQGPYPGTFVAAGMWGEENILACQYGMCKWFFHEVLKIRSGSRTISRTIAGRGRFSVFPTRTTFGPVSGRDLRFRGGYVETSLIKRGYALVESLH
jgi:hypothetical protein